MFFVVRPSDLMLVAYWKKRSASSHARRYRPFSSAPAGPPNSSPVKGFPPGDPHRPPWPPGGTSAVYETVTVLGAFETWREILGKGGDHVILWWILGIFFGGGWLYSTIRCVWWCSSNLKFNMILVLLLMTCCDVTHWNTSYMRLYEQLSLGFPMMPAPNNGFWQTNLTYCRFRSLF